MNLQEEVRAQVDHPDITRTGRIRRPPERLGIELDRGPEDEPEMTLQLSEPPSREVTPSSSAPQSPDSSWYMLDLLLLPPPPPPPVEPPDVLVRHRHFTIGGGETDPDRLYPMIDWMPYPEERPPPSF